MKSCLTWVFLALICWLGLCAPTVSPAAASSGAAGGDVLFFAREGWVWRCDGDGVRRERLVEGFLPGARPDGGAVAFFRPADPSGDLTELWLHDTVRNETRRLARDLAGFSAPVWFPDGSPDASGLAVLARDKEGRTRVAALRADGSGLRTVFAEGEEGAGFLCSLSVTPDGALLVHDMASAYWLNPGGGVRERIPLEKIMGREAAGVTSSDRLAVCPTDPDVLVFSHSCPGTARFESVMHEPNTTLSLHDRWLGKGKNMRILAEDMTAFDPVWSADGKRIYFIGYRDTQAAEADLFRIFRVGRHGAGLKELGLGEGVSVGAKP